jgi:transcriptional regulator with XRE-family HTH domain
MLAGVAHMRYVRVMSQKTTPVGRNVNLPIGQNVRAERVRRGEKQDSVARVLGISQASYSERERGEVPFTGTELFLIAVAFEIDVSTFFPSEVPALASEVLSHAAA